jgi:hypothetical protein
MKKQVKFSTVVFRLRRFLAIGCIRLVKTKGGMANRWYSDLGEWHTVDANNCTAGYVDPVAMARKYGLLRDGEEVIDSTEATAA